MIYEKIQFHYNFYRYLKHITRRFQKIQKVSPGANALEAWAAAEARGRSREPRPRPAAKAWLNMTRQWQVHSKNYPKKNIKNALTPCLSFFSSVHDLENIVVSSILVICSFFHRHYLICHPFWGMIKCTIIVSKWFWIIIYIYIYIRMDETDAMSWRMDQKDPKSRRHICVYIYIYI